MNSQTDFDVIVVGGGLIGATTATLFVQKGFKVGLIESNSFNTWKDGPYRSRVCAINHASEKIFSELGVWETIKSLRVSPYRAMSVWDENSSASIQFDSADFHVQHLGHIIENDVITHALIEKLSQNYTATLFENTSIKNLTSHADGVSVFLSGQPNPLACRLLVGADGSHSDVREIANLTTTEYNFDQQAIVATIESERSHQQTAWQRFLETGPVALLPLQNNLSSLVWSCDNDKIDALMTLDDAHFCQALEMATESQLGSMTNVSQRVCFPLKQHHSNQYIARHIALVGDAAHCVHPLAGLGANLGVLDAATLVEVANEAKSRGRDFSNRSTLRRYERWRMGENAVSAELLKAFKKGFGSNRPLTISAREFAMNQLNKTTLLKQLTAKLAMGLVGDLPEICRR